MKLYDYAALPATRIEGLSKGRIVEASSNFLLAGRVDLFSERDADSSKG